ncbi:MAG TPA: HAMP domain-containing sensor histidine kinase, partial [Pyrinomonadaceae bacterium]|nr:HAMP domain-containing sensor histidine kinase [Pyrinomonadaceae bacterium]
DVCEAIRDTFVLLKHSPDIKEHHILKADLPENPVYISADPTQLKQIFWNLARNSICAMPNGGVLSVKLEDLSHNRIGIVFTDSGCGMSAAQVEQLFEPFSNSTNGGTGLGLSIVYQIVRDHGGVINVRSLENEGTSITVKLPSSVQNSHALSAENATENTITVSRLEGFLNVQSRETDVL